MARNIVRYSNLDDRFGIQGGWSPSIISTVFWYDAADTDTITESSGSVSQWDDKSGNDRHLKQISGSLQPTTGTRSIGNLNALDFTDHEMVIDNDLGLSQPNTWYIVYKDDDIIQVQYLTDSASGGRQVIFHDGGKKKHFAGSALDSGISGNTNEHVLVATFNGSTSRIWRDGTAGTEGDVGSNGIGQIKIGRNSSGSAPYNGLFGEIICVPSTPSEGERQGLEGYLAWKWGLTGNLPSNHPWKNTPPTRGG